MGKYEEWFEGQPWDDTNDPHYNKDGNDLPDWFGDKRHFRPWYDDDTDYNTNAKSYYDYIAYRTRQLDYIIDAINKALSRGLQVSSTNTIDFEKLGEWLNKDDIETLKAFVKISNQTLNATKANDDGIYTKDLSPDIDQLRSDLERVRDNLQRQIDALKRQVEQILQAISSNGKVEVPRHISIDGNHYLINKVDLGDITDQTRVAITGHLGSTRLTTSYYVSELKTDLSHLFIGNTIDDTGTLQYSEIFTKITDGNKLWATTQHTFHVSATDQKITEMSKCYDSNGKPYYDTQSPEYLDESNQYQHMIWIDKVVVYDLKDPVSLN